MLKEILPILAEAGKIFMKSLLDAKVREKTNGLFNSLEELDPEKAKEYHSKIDSMFDDLKRKF
ncbi:hypothetical protein [Thermovibrio sp.]